MMFEGGVSALPHVRSGKLRALATTGRKRTEAMLELPTMAESGVADFDITVWFGLVAPANTPRPIIERLNREVGEILRTRELKDKFAAAGVDITPSTPESARRAHPRRPSVLHQADAGSRHPAELASKPNCCIHEAAMPVSGHMRDVSRLTRR